jgi:hypothetical protein
LQQTETAWSKENLRESFKIGMATKQWKQIASVTGGKSRKFNLNANTQYYRLNAPTKSSISI